MRSGSTEITLVLGDITKQKVDAIVNAANSSLMGGGGVDGAIHRAGGPAILAECKRIREERGACATGDAVVTTAGKLPARWVVHTVGPIWTGGESGEPALLRRCHEKSLALAADQGARTVALPAISTGVYGYPVDRAARVALGAAKDFAAKDDRLAEIRFVLFSESDLEAFRLAEGELS
jgi:O-acetyl-ADP-ribose deacetylase (regulator of RNase III)